MGIHKPNLKPPEPNVLFNIGRFTSLSFSINIYRSNCWPLSSAFGAVSSNHLTPLEGFLGFLVSASVSAKMVLPNDIDLLNPPPELEKRRHKLKRLVQSPNSFFMDVKCQGCFNITTVFSHSQTVVVCGNCQTVLCQPTGGRARLTEGCSFRKKGD
ncbi:40S ribosomal protein S27-2-like [Macadamia integrifolia]|uniref:40S ribosomal protein S27-2-like n=1 Tax=Macadamia integrifolia TaxID=60698 RepID=UPI001C50260C|nr:40S ribosomal protein S27-2-like [Macadamia integrifolia]